MATLEILDHGVCKVAVAPVRAEASDAAEIVTQLLFGDYVQVLQAGRPWIKIKMAYDGYEGWMDFKQLSYITDSEYSESHRLNHQSITNQTLYVYGPSGPQILLMGGSLPNLEDNIFGFGDEKFEFMQDLEDTPADPVDTALKYLNTPYLWGGKSPFGIDCSGLAQIVARIHGLNVPRDTSQQVHYGEAIDFKDRKAGDLLFFSNSKGRVGHVGILVEKDVILHAAGCVRRDMVNTTGIFRADFDDYSHTFHSIRRWFE